MNMLRSVIFGVLVFFISSAWGVTKSPTIKRACMNFNDSIVTISWHNIQDACGSFTKLDVYGKSGADPFGPLGTTSDVFDTEISIKLPNNNGDWEFHLRVHNLCDGVSTDDSPIIKLDLKNPDVPIIDSVSIDVTTQKPILGWRDIADQDRKSFRVYTQNNGINNIIGETPNLFFSVDGQPITSRVQYTLAGIDSCDKVGLISTLVSPVVLSLQFNSCTRESSLTWSPYVGWQTDYYRIFYRINGGPWVHTGEDLTSLNRLINIGTFGDQVDYFVRSFHVSSGFTSSSNMVSVSIPEKEEPSENKLLLATLDESENYVQVISTYTSKSADSLVLYRTNSGYEYLNHTKTNPGSNRIVWSSDNSFSRNTQNSYTILAYHTCDGVLDTTNTGTTVFLTLENDILTWNRYEEWENNVDYYDILATDGSTWNTIGSTEDSVFTLDKGSDTYCFRVRAVSNPIDGEVFESLSNRVCLDVSTKVFIPNAINPKSSNNRFFVTGQNIDYNQSTISIYNRWGQKIITIDDLKAGYTFPVLEYPTGVYIYSGRITDLNNNIQTVEGEIWIVN
jgi:hypothetical protein